MEETVRTPRSSTLPSSATRFSDGPATASSCATTAGPCGSPPGVISHTPTPNSSTTASTEATTPPAPDEAERNRSMSGKAMIFAEEKARPEPLSCRGRSRS